MNQILNLVLRHYNSIIDGLRAEPSGIYPVLSRTSYRGRDYDDAEGWANGFVEGMKLCRDDWVPLLNTPEGQEWFRPIGLLGMNDFSPDQDDLAKTPTRRAKLVPLLTKAVVSIHAFWLPHREAVYRQRMARVMQAKVGRNEPCPSGSGKKFKKCCGQTSALN